MASVSPLGGVIYTNQASPFVAQIHQASQQRPDMIQFSLNQTIVTKEQEVEKVSQPTEEHGINPDQEHAQDNSGMYKQKKHEHEEEPEDEAPHATAEPHHLDIKV